MESPPPRRKRLIVSGIAVGLFVFHWVLSSRLSQFSRSLSNALESDYDDDEAGEGDGQGQVQASLYGIVTLISIARLWSLCSAGIALVGVYSIYKTNLPLLRLFTLNTFLSIGLDLFLLLLTLVLLSLSMKASSSSSSSSSKPTSSIIATTLCQTLSNQNSASSSKSSSSSSTSPLGGGGGGGWLPDLMGLSLEQCEEKLSEGHILTSLLTFVGFVEGVRLVCGIKLLGYYAGLAKGLGVNRGGGYYPLAMTDHVLATKPSRGSNKRKNSTGSSGLRVDTKLASIGKEINQEERYYDSPVEDDGHLAAQGMPSSPGGGGGGGSSSRSKGKGKQRDRATSSASSPPGSDQTRILVLHRASRDDVVPTLSVTPSTPNQSKFPLLGPSPSSSHRSQTLPDEKTRKILVYQPIMMTVEEAMQHGASEVSLSKPPRRARSHSTTQTPRPAPPSSTSTIVARSNDRRPRSSTITPASSTGNRPPSGRTGLTLVTSSPTHSSPPALPSPSRSSTNTSSRTIRQDSDDLLTPRGDDTETSFTAFQFDSSDKKTA